MNTTNPARIGARATVGSLAGAAQLTVTVMLALLALYFLGYDQGATSVFGANTQIHEFVHDARHLLGFPCH